MVLILLIIIIYLLAQQSGRLPKVEKPIDFWSKFMGIFKDLLALAMALLLVFCCIMLVLMIGLFVVWVFASIFNYVVG